ncbi:unnamed protein product [Mycena citricolor]|uniref:DNA polymerase delta subunit 3 n=1 Tax=Mycena citricolor TaxID=2018698 RepID=A0AAD2H2G7_9AGAR|nr:unnamed protein product [Mycena citricolor]
MTSQSIRDYLTKEILIENNIASTVTFRSLSRAFSLHVNLAKKLHATYLLSGETQKPPPSRLSKQAARNQSDDVDMEDDDMTIYAPVHDEKEEEEEEEEYIPQIEMMLVNEKDLEGAFARAKFESLDSIHVYSLSSAVIKDAGLLCTPTDFVVRKLDDQKGDELAKVVGRISCAAVQVSNKPIQHWGNRNAPTAAPAVPAAGPSKPADTTAKKQAEDKLKGKEKPKATGKLDFSKAKTKPPPEKKEEKFKAEPKSKAKEAVSRQPSMAKTTSGKVQEKMDESKKRGLKRKSALASESEEEEEVEPPAKPPPKAVVESASSSVRARKGVILSDDEDDAAAPKSRPIRKGKAKAVVPDSDSEVEEQKKHLRAMMDIDDDDVSRSSFSKPPSPVPTDEGSDVDMEEPEEKPKRAPVKRKPKKVVPIGSNGLKKKRVVKSKATIDEKGYMVTQDYSEYETADEEGPEEVKKETKPKPKAKAKVDKAKAEQEKAPAKKTESKPPAAAKPKLKPSGPSKQGNLSAFFAKK